jgi:hypothetical protein
MRKPLHIGLAVVVVIAVVVGVYTAIWVTIADRLKEGAIGWAQAQRAEKIKVEWRRLSVTGFPFAFRVEFTTALMRDDALSPAPELHVAALTGTVRPWDFDDWKLVAPAGLSVDMAAADNHPAIQVAARLVTGALSVGAQGDTTIWLTAHDATSSTGAGAITVKRSEWWVIVPAQSPRTHSDPDFSLAAALHDITLPAALPALGKTVDEIAFGAVAKGVIPDGPLPKAIAAWRDSGGTVELNNLRIVAGQMAANGSGTLALDQELQPMGGFSGSVEGYDQIMAALVANGQMQASDAGLARLGLAMLAKAGPDGRPEIKTSFTIQNGEMFLGPAKLGRLPRIVW